MIGGKPLAIQWPKDWPVNKGLLLSVIQDRIRRRMGLTFINFGYFHQLSTDDLVLVAMQMGYRPPETFIARLKEEDQRHIRRQQGGEQ